MEPPQPKRGQAKRKRGERVASDEGEGENDQPHGLLSSSSANAQPNDEVIVDDQSPEIYAFTEELEAKFNNVLNLQNVLKGSAREAKNTLEASFARLKIKVPQCKERPQPKISFFGPTFSGKSFIINTIAQRGLGINSPELGPLPSGASAAQGLTAFPIALRYAEQAQLHYEFENGDASEVEELEHADAKPELLFQEVTNKLRAISTNKARTIRRAVFEYPFPFLREQGIELLDLPGHNEEDDKLSKIRTAMISNILHTSDIICVVCPGRGVCKEVVQNLVDAEAFTALHTHQPPKLLFVMNAKDDKEQTKALLKARFKLLLSLKKYLATSLNIQTKGSQEAAKQKKPAKKSRKHTDDEDDENAQNKILGHDPLKLADTLDDEACAMVFVNDRLTMDDLPLMDNQFIEAIGAKCKKLIHNRIEETKEEALHILALLEFLASRRQVEDADNQAGQLIKDLEAGLKLKRKVKFITTCKDAENWILANWLAEADRSWEKFFNPSSRKLQIEDLQRRYKLSWAKIFQFWATKAIEEINQAAEYKFPLATRSEAQVSFVQRVYGYVEYIKVSLLPHQMEIFWATMEGIIDWKLCITNYSEFQDQLTRLCKPQGVLQAFIISQVLPIIRGYAQFETSQVKEELSKAIQEVSVLHNWFKDKFKIEPIKDAKQDDWHGSQAILPKLDSRTRSLKMPAGPVDSLLDCKPKVVPSDAFFKGKKGQKEPIIEKRTESELNQRLDYIDATPHSNSRVVASISIDQTNRVTRITYKKADCKDLLDYCLQPQPKQQHPPVVQQEEKAKTNDEASKKAKKGRKKDKEKELEEEEREDNEKDERKDKAKDKKNENITLYPIFVTSRPRSFTPTAKCPQLLFDELETDHHLYSYFVFVVIAEQYLDQYLAWTEHMPGANRMKIITISDVCIGIGRKRTAIMLLAEHWSLPYCFLVDDDIGTYYEYDPRHRLQRPTRPARALSFMQDVARQHTYSQDREDIADRKNILKQFNTRHLKPLVSAAQGETWNRLFDFVTEKFPNSTSAYAINPDLLLRDLLDEAPSLYAQAYEMLHTKKVGQVGLLDVKSNSQNREYPLRLRKPSPRTHLVSTVRQQVVFYNINATKGVYHVSDEQYFGARLEEPTRVKLVKTVMKMKGAQKKQCLEGHILREQGYKFSDSAYVRHLAMAGVGGYMVYYFGYEALKGVKSLVNGDVSEVPKKLRPEEDEKEEDRAPKQGRSKGQEKRRKRKEESAEKEKEKEKEKEAEEEEEEEEQSKPKKAKPAARSSKSKASKRKAPSQAAPKSRSEASSKNACKRTRKEGK